MHSCKTKALIVLVACALGIVVPSPSLAGFIMRIESAGTMVEIVDNGALDQDPLVGQITFGNTTVGDYFINKIAGTSKPLVGDVDNSALQITSLETRNGTTGSSTMTISLSDTDFTVPVGPQLMLGSAIGVTFRKSAAGDTITFQSYADASNAQFGLTTTTGAQTFVSPGGTLPQGFSDTKTTTFTRGSGPFSLTNITTITLSGDGEANTSGTTAVTGVPAPAGLVLALAGLPCLGAAQWLRSRRRQPA